MHWSMWVWVGVWRCETGIKSGWRPALLFNLNHRGKDEKDSNVDGDDDEDDDDEDDDEDDEDDNHDDHWQTLLWQR